MFIDRLDGSLSTSKLFLSKQVFFLENKYDISVINLIGSTLKLKSYRKHCYYLIAMLDMQMIQLSLKDFVKGT